MINKKVLKILVIIILCFCIFPRNTYALTAKFTKKWTSTLGLSNQTFNTKGASYTRETKNVGGFWVEDKGRVFCVEPGAKFTPASGITGYSEGTTAPTSSGHLYDVSGDVEHLKKILSCWHEETSSIIAEQALVWELVTEERSSINATDILGGTYKPKMSDGKVYGDNSGVTSLYERIYALRNDSKGKNIYSEYKAILRCAARFNIATPSWAGATSSAAKAQELSTYNDSTQTFSRTFSHGSIIASDLFKYYTFKINGTEVNCKKGATASNVKCSCDNAKCTFSTTSVISKSSPVKVEFKYTYQNDGSTKLRTDAVKYYTKSGYQALMDGSTSKSFYINLYTDTKPTYQIKITKKDSETGKAIEGVKFNIYSDSAAKNKIGTTTATDKNGVATYSKISKIGTYYIKEAETKDGYKTNGNIYSVAVKAGNTVEKASYATKTITNTPTHLKMTKYTIDEDGNKTKLSGDACEIPKCANEENRDNGPIFTITKDDKKVCVTETGTDGIYRFASLSASCADGTTDKIKTCKGEFSIANMPAGTYKVTEIATACGTTLPENNSKTITVAPGKDQAVTMENGVSGVVFHKVNENGNLLTGGKFALQKKENGIYKDMLLVYDKGVIYKYDSTKTEENGATYLLDTHDSGIINVIGLPTGEYRFVEKEAPEGYNAIKDKDSTATFTISDKSQDEYQQVELVNRKSKTVGSYDSAELIVTIITGRRVINYVVVIGGLIVLLGTAIFLRNKYKK